MSNSLWPHGLWPTRLLCSWDFPSKHTGVDCHFLPQGIFPTWGLNLCLLNWQVESLHHLGSLYWILPMYPNLDTRAEIGVLCKIHFWPWRYLWFILPKTSSYSVHLKIRGNAYMESCKEKPWSFIKCWIGNMNTWRIW